MNENIEWTCDECGSAIEDGEGYLTVDVSKAKEAKRQDTEWKNEHPATSVDVTDMVDQPDSVPWQAMHGACDPRSEFGDYKIDLDRIRTAHHALGWTLHLHGKNWTGVTDWNSFIRVPAGATMDRLRA